MSPLKRGFADHVPDPVGGVRTRAKRRSGRASHGCDLVRSAGREDVGGEAELRKIYVPISTAQLIYNQPRTIHQLMFTVGTSDVDESHRIAEIAHERLASKHGVSLDDRRAIRVQHNLERFMKMTRVFGWINVFVWIVGIGTLLAGIVRSFRYRPFLQGQRASAFVCLALVIGIVNYPFPFPSIRERRPSTVEYHLPVQGEWTVAWGGDDSRTNLLARWRADRRWGLDLLKTDERGKSFGSAGTRLADFHAFDQPVFAPCSAATDAVTPDTVRQPCSSPVTDSAWSPSGSFSHWYSV